MLPDCFESEKPDREELWLDIFMQSINQFVSLGEWNFLFDWSKQNINSSLTSRSFTIPDINSTTRIEDLFSGKYLPKGILSNDALWLQNQQIKTETVTTSVRYHRHSYTIKIPFNCPLDEEFKGKSTLKFLVEGKKFKFLLFKYEF